MYSFTVTVFKKKIRAHPTNTEQEYSACIDFQIKENTYMFMYA